MAANIVATIDHLQPDEAVCLALSFRPAFEERVRQEDTNEKNRVDTGFRAPDLLHGGFC